MKTMSEIGIIIDHHHVIKGISLTYVSHPSIQHPLMALEVPPTTNLCIHLHLDTLILITDCDSGYTVLYHNIKTN
jgi:hypothetical protein